MKFNQQTPLDNFLNMLFDRYQAKVPAVKQITQALVERGVVNSQQDIVNDHIAFRTLRVPHLGIASFEKIFLHHGYQKKDYYFFEGKKLNAYWYAPPSGAYPRIFISELLVDQLSTQAQEVIHNYTDEIKSDPVDQLDLDNGQEVGAFFHEPLWTLPTKQNYLTLLNESEYAAWVIYNRYYLNHYTISVHALKEGYNTIQAFDDFVEGLGIQLNTSGGKIKISADELLLQSSTIAEMQEASFANNETLNIAGSYVEFAERRILPEFKILPLKEVKPQHRRDGFEATNADKIFESTYIGQAENAKPDR